MSSRLDFLRHLRLVHFALVGTCTILLVGSSATTSYQLENAYRQAGEIRQSAAKLADWARQMYPGSVMDQIRRVDRESPLYVIDRGYAYQPIGDYSAGLVVDEAGAFFQLPSCYGFGEPPAECREQDPLYRLVFQNYRSGFTGGFGAGFGSGQYPTPSTLESFIELWDTLGAWTKPRSVIGWRPEEAAIVLREGADRIIHVSDSADGSAEAPNSLPDGREEYIERGTDGWRLRIAFEDAGLLPIAEVTVPLIVEDPRQDLQSQAIALLGTSWRPGPFDLAFRDLSRFVSSIKSISLQDLELHLASLRSEIDPGIQLFGARVPTRLLRRWGLLILLGVQTYFALHLDRYLRVYPVKADVEFPWLGHYDSLPSRVCFVGSIFLLPVCVSGMLLFRHPGPPEPLQESLFSWAAALASVFVALVTLLLATRLHREVT